MNTIGPPRVCVLTPPGRGAVAVVGIEGAGSVAAVDRYFLAANGCSLNEQPPGRINYGHWGSPQGEDLVVCGRGLERLEIHCHGGQQSSAQIVADLIRAGCEVVNPEHWLASQHGCSLTAAAHLALTQASTLRTATILLDQYQGALRSELDAIRTDIAAGEKTSAAKRLESLLQWTDFGLHLTEPWEVVIAGEPNVGKSSLINALVGFSRAIVFDQPGTTRDVVSSITAIDGWPVELSDTAGLHAAVDTPETAGIELAKQRMATADLVVWVLDASSLAVTPDETWALAERQARNVGVALGQDRTQLVINKMDLVDHLDDYFVDHLVVPPIDHPVEKLATSAATGAGITNLLAVIANRLVPSVPPSGAAVPFTAEQIAELRQMLGMTHRG